MNKKIITKLVSLLLVMLAVLSVTPINAFAVEGQIETQAASHSLVLKSESLTIAVRRTTKMTATVTNVSKQPAFTWSSSDESVATVNENGVVTGKSEGKAVIKAKAKVDGKTLTGEFTINVVSGGNFIKDLLVGQQVLSYQYSYHDDYYYTNDKEAWQYNFGFGKIYDFVSPYILLEYDYIRVFFTYEDKDWMIQMWKGQYGMIFYGGEIGVYNRPHSEDGVNEWTMYNCPAEEDWLKMEMTLYHQELDGTWTREFTRGYDYYWWCTGFKNGHLRQEEPADELRLTGRITFKDEKMRKLFTDGLKECGFGASKDKNSLGIDEYYAKGKDVYFKWQNISEAESTMAIKVGVGLLSSIAALPFAPLLAPLVSMYAMMVIFASMLV